MGVTWSGSKCVVRCDDPHRRGCRQETAPRSGPVTAEQQAERMGWRYNLRAEMWSCPDCRSSESVSASTVVPDHYEQEGGVELAAEIVAAVVTAPPHAETENPGEPFGGGETGGGGAGGEWKEGGKSSEADAGEPGVEPDAPSGDSGGNNE